MKTRQEIIADLQELEREYFEQITSIRRAIFVLGGRTDVQLHEEAPAIILKPPKQVFLDKVCENAECGKTFTPKNDKQRYCDCYCSSKDQARIRKAKRVHKESLHTEKIFQSNSTDVDEPQEVKVEKKNSPESHFIFSLR